VSYRDLCNDILNLDGIRFAAVITMEGSILFSGFKEGIHPLLSIQEAEASIFRAAIRMGTRKEFLDKLGGINYAFAEYGKINQYTIPLNKEVNTLLLVSEDKPQHENSGDRNLPIGVERIMQVLMKHCER
jgi:superfamily I DNA and/or RNA helicase